MPAWKDFIAIEVAAEVVVSGCAQRSCMNIINQQEYSFHLN